MKTVGLLAGLLAVMVGLMPEAVLAKPKVVDCAITSLPGGEVQFSGKCRFVPEAGGSFSLMDAAGKDRFYGTIGMVSVYLTGQDAAEVSGLVLDKSGGHNSRWGEARRSQEDRACWDGADFRICAW